MDFENQNARTTIEYMTRQCETISKTQFNPNTNTMKNIRKIGDVKFMEKLTKIMVVSTIKKTQLTDGAS